MKPEVDTVLQRRQRRSKPHTHTHTDNRYGQFGEVVMCDFSEMLEYKPTNMLITIFHTAAWVGVIN